MIQIGIGKYYSCYRRISYSTRMQFASSFNLRAEVRRRAQQKPQATVMADRNLRLGSRFAGKCARA